jgi:hypothetical protein
MDRSRVRQLWLGFGETDSMMLAFLTIFLQLISIG